MAEGDVYVNCSTFDSVEDLIRLVCVTDDCETPYITCDNSYEGLIDILRKLIREDANGDPAVAVCGCDGSGSSATIKQSLESVTNGVAYPVAFASGFTDNTYSLLIYIHDVTGANVGFTLNTRTKDGFTITPAASGTMNWIAIKE